MAREAISVAVVRRLPRYYRYFEMLERESVQRISSGELAARMGLTASQIRQDFNCFGGFGQQGYGYNVSELRQRFFEIMGLYQPHKAILVGVGNLGRALLGSFNFEKRGVSLVAAFDTAETVIGRQYGELVVQPMSALSAFLQEAQPSVAVLTIPREVAESVAAQLAREGIVGIWNFTSIDLHLQNPDILVENVHFGDTLATLSYRLSQNQKEV